MARNLENTVPFGDDTMADLPVDYSFRDYRREAREKARQEAIAAEEARAAAAALEDDDILEMTDEESLDAIESFMAEEQQARAEEARVGRISSGILEKIEGLSEEEFLKTQTMTRSVINRPKPAASSEPVQLPPPTPEEDDWPQEDYRPVWLYWAIGITACLVAVALIYIFLTR